MGAVMQSFVENRIPVAKPEACCHYGYHVAGFGPYRLANRYDPGTQCIDKIGPPQNHRPGR